MEISVQDATTIHIRHPHSDGDQPMVEVETIDGVKILRCTADDCEEEIALGAEVPVPDREVPEEEIDDNCYVCGTEVDHYDMGTFRCPECDIYYGLLKDGSFEVSDIGNRLSQNQLEKLSEATGESWFL